MSNPQEQVVNMPRTFVIEVPEGEDAPEHLRKIMEQFPVKSELGKKAERLFDGMAKWKGLAQELNEMTSGVFDPMLNKGLDYPLVSAGPRNGKKVQPLNRPFINDVLLNIKVIGARPGYYYRLAWYGNGSTTDIKGAIKNYVWQFEEVKISDWEKPIDRNYVVDVATQPIYGTGVQTLTIANALSEHPITFLVTIDTDKALEMEGAGIALWSEGHKGYTYIIDPANYVYNVNAPKPDLPGVIKQMQEHTSKMTDAKNAVVGRIKTNIADGAKAEIKLIEALLVNIDGYLHQPIKTGYLQKDLINLRVNITALLAKLKGVDIVFPAVKKESQLVSNIEGIVLISNLSYELKPSTVFIDGSFEDFPTPTGYKRDNENRCFTLIEITQPLKADN